MLVLMCVLAITSTALASEVVFNVPKANNGVVTPDIDFCGVDAYALLNSSVPVCITKVPTLVYGVIVTTSALLPGSGYDPYALLKDTAPAALAAGELYQFNAMGATAWDALACKVSPVRSSSSTVSTVITFPAPVIFSNGLAAACMYSSVNVAGLPNVGVTVLYRKLVR